jgi:hypothetical protein
LEKLGFLSGLGIEASLPGFVCAFIEDFSPSLFATGVGFVGGFFSGSVVITGLFFLKDKFIFSINKNFKEFIFVLNDEITIYLFIYLKYPQMSHFHILEF